MESKNKQLLAIIKELNILGSEMPAWKKVAREMSRSNRSQRTVNLTKINKFAKDGLTVVVPGKVLGIGTVDKKLTVVAYTFSESALAKIKAAGGKATLLSDYIAKKPSNKGVQIIC